MLYFAHDENENIIFIEKAIKKKDYYCPQCKGILRVKSGTKKCKHFFHLNCENCGVTNETLAHKYFKEHITDFINFIQINERISTYKKNIEKYTKEIITDDARRNGNLFHIKYNAYHETFSKTEKKKYKIKSFKTEVQIKENNIIIIPDILVELENGDLCAIEIYYSNKKTDEHKLKYKKLNLSAIEIKINDKCEIIGVRTLFNKNDIDNDFDKYINTEICKIRRRLFKQEYKNDWKENWSKIHKLKTFNNLNEILKNAPIDFLKLSIKENNYDDFFKKYSKKLFIHSDIRVQKPTHDCIFAIPIMYENEIINKIKQFVREYDE